MHATRSAQSGFTLIEGMIAAVVLGAGLLALSGMQAISFGRNVDANELTRVTNLAADMLERIQFNRRNVLAYNNIDTLNAATQPPTSQPMARGDYAQWQALLNSSGLAGVQGRVTVAAIGPTTPPLNQNSVTVTITWSGSVRGETSVMRNKVVTLTTVVSPE
ncbi:MAG TPA: prepilin-type N-terminal cleavage/methylation domain-containing protein [Nitrospiraceae bacterium]|jgi:type IV pilus assembly protein PilV|nr:prepilin-type N-terminal cleavage/methylation domain-containing protein [Nitrospiraceae bacterium]